MVEGTTGHVLTPSRLESTINFLFVIIKMRLFWFLLSWFQIWDRHLAEKVWKIQFLSTSIEWLELHNISKFQKNVDIFSSLEIVDFQDLVLPVAGILWESRRSEANRGSNCTNHILTRIIINCGINHKQMCISWTIYPSLIWGCTLEPAVCSSSPGHSWCWSKIWWSIPNIISCGRVTPNSYFITIHLAWKGSQYNHI